MFEERIIDPAVALVEQSQLDKSEDFFSEHELLDTIPLDSRGRLVRRVAKMITAVHATIFDAVPGTAHIISLGLDFYSSEEKTIIALGEKLESEVSIELFFVDTDQANNLIDEIENLR